jgi:hypothetical protein
MKLTIPAYDQLRVSWSRTGIHQWGKHGQLDRKRLCRWPGYTAQSAEPKQKSQPCQVATLIPQNPNTGHNLPGCDDLDPPEPKQRLQLARLRLLSLRTQTEVATFQVATTLIPQNPNRGCNSYPPEPKQKWQLARLRLDPPEPQMDNWPGCPAIPPEPNMRQLKLYSIHRDADT